MKDTQVVWLPSVRNKLITFRSPRFTPEETLDYISNLVLETEVLLRNDVIKGTYREEFGEYKGIQRIVIKRFRIYFERIEDIVIILAVLFPGEN